MAFTLTIDGEIGSGLSSKAVFAEALAEAGSDDIELRISSIGGSLDDALSIHDLLKSHPGNVTARLDGIVASAATIIAVAADEVKMSENAFFMVHKVMSPMFFGGMLNEEDIEGMINELQDLKEVQQKMDLTVANIYSKATGRRPATMLKLMAAETWMTAAEAREQGFVNTVTSPSKKNNLQALALVAKAGGLPPITLTQNQPIMNQDEKKSFLVQLREDIKDIFKSEATPETPEVVEDEAADEPQEETISKEEVTEVVAEVTNELKAEFEAKAAEKDTEMEQLKQELAKAKAKLTDTEPSEGAPVADSAPVSSTRDAFANVVRNAWKRRNNPYTN